MLSDVQKVVWAEGVLLGQQHFQQWDRYQAFAQHFISHATQMFAYGIKHLVIDEELLTNGQLVIRELSAILPNGFILNYDARYDEPLALALNAKSPQQTTTAIYLALPLAQSTCWKTYYQLLPDQHDTERKREVLLAKPNLTLLKADESQDQYHVLPIAVLTHDGFGHYRLDETFIPTALSVNATHVLPDLLRRLIELLSAKNRVLLDRRRQFHGEVTEFGQHDLTHFLLLQLFNSTLPLLQHYYQFATLHPHKLYEVLISFAGSLMAFGQEQNLPIYNHDKLTETFSDLFQTLNTLLENAMPSRMASLRLIRESDTLYAVDSIDSSLFAKSSFFIAVLHESADLQWLAPFARQVKLGARSVIESIVISALPGVKLTHMQRPPSKLPIKAGYEYFYIEPQGDFWDQIKVERTLALFTPLDFMKAQIELVTVQE